MIFIKNTTWKYPKFNSTVNDPLGLILISLKACVRLLWQAGESECARTNKSINGSEADASGESETVIVWVSFRLASFFLSPL